MRVLAAMGVWLLIGTTPVLAWGQTAGSPGSSNQAPYTLQVNSRVVLTDVTVTDKQGNPITDLTENDFRLLDNGKPQKITADIAPLRMAMTRTILLKGPILARASRKLFPVLSMASDLTDGA